MQRSMTLLVVVALLLVGCTNTAPDPSPTATSPSPTVASPDVPSPTPPPGRVAVVVSPEPPLAAAAAEIGARRVAADGTDLRVVTADDPSFVLDLVTFFATEGYDLVCAVGAGAEQAVRDVAPSSPSTRFCAAPARPANMPENVLPIDLRVEELGYVAGVALAADGLEGPAGLVTSSTTWAPRRLEAGLRAGLEAGGVVAPIVISVGPTNDEDVVIEEVTTLLEQGVAGVLSLAGTLDAAVRDVLAEVPVTPPAPPAPSPTAGATTATATPSPSPTEVPETFAGLVAGPEVRPSEDGAELADIVLAVLELHLEQAVALAVDRHVGQWSTEPATVGLADDAFRVDVGSSGRATAVRSAVDDAVTAVRERDVEVPAG